MAVLDRYISKEIALNTLGVGLVLLLIMLSHRLVRYLALAASGQLPGGAIFSLLGLKTASYLILLLPLSLYLAILLLMGRLYRDHEMAALAACGVGVVRLYKPVLWVALPMVAILAWLSLVALPQAAQLEHQITAEARRSLDIGSISPGRFRETEDGRSVIYVEKLSADRKGMQNVFIQARTDHRRILLSAREGYLEIDPHSGDRYLVLRAGYRYEGQPGAVDFAVVRFAKHRFLLAKKAAAEPVQHPDARPTTELWNSTQLPDRAELQWRLSIPFAALVVAVLAVPLSRVDPRSGRYGKLFLAIIIFTAYVNLLALARTWIERGTLSPVLGLWWVHGLLLLAAVLLLLRQYGWAGLFVRRRSHPKPRPAP